MSFLSAVLAGEGVSLERREKRLKICSICKWVFIKKKRNDTKVVKCSICGCPVSAAGNILNLARYEETKRYGCKHRKGSRWKKAGV